MRSFLRSIFRKSNTKSKVKKLNAATAHKVLKFLGYGLSYGAESLKQNYQPADKVVEFVAVSGALLQALKVHADHPASPVTVSVRINDTRQMIKLMQVGEHVVLALDRYQIIISLITLEEIYIRLRNDILSHEDIYGNALFLMAEACKNEESNLSDKNTTPHFP